MIEIEHLTFSYHSGSKPALRDINLRIKTGDFVLLTGNSGSGKSTLVRCLNGLIPHFHGGKIAGKICVNNKNPLELTPKQMATEVGFVFQNTNNQLFMNTVENEIVFGLENLAIAPEKMESRINESLIACQIEHLRYRSLNQLSGGERQKVAIASILAMYPRYIILDEPTAELDGESANSILGLLTALNRDRNLTIILIEHRLERILPLCNRLIIMDGGKIIKDGHPLDIMTNNLTDLNLRIPPTIRLATRLKLKISSLYSSKLHSAFSSYINSLPPSSLDKFAPIEKKQIHRLPAVDYDKISPNLEINGVHFAYEGKKDVLHDITLQFKAGEMVGIIGKNGSGKSTLLKLFNGLLRPRKGTIRINGKNSARSSISDLAGDIGYIFQNPSLQFYQDTVEEEILFYVRNLQTGSRKKRLSSTTSTSALLEEIMRIFKLHSYKTQYPRYLSVGEQQKVALGSVYITRPSILLLDEPTHGMDDAQKREFFAILRNYAKTGKIVIVISHDIETLAEFSERILYLNEGTVESDGTPAEILPKTELFNTEINRLFSYFPRLPQTILTYEEAADVLSNDQN